MPGTFRFLTTPKILLDPAMVIGHIRWRRVLGLPNGDLGKAFSIRVHHIDRIPDGHFESAGTQPLNVPHAVDAWEGPHDDAFYRVTFMTEAVQPRGYSTLVDSDSSRPERLQNFLDIEFRPGTVWPNRPRVRAGVKTLRPAHLVFDPPGRVQVLPDIEVVQLPFSLAR